jgi:uncharacterized protein (DUF58 family)
MRLKLGRSDEKLAGRDYWYLLAVILLAVSIATHKSFVLLGVFFTFLIGAVPEYWYKQALRRFEVRQQLSRDRAFFGETVALEISMENYKALPLPWIEFEDDIPSDLPVVAAQTRAVRKEHRTLLVDLLSLWAFQRVTRRYKLRCLKRGSFLFGPLTIRTGDPLGWLVREERFPAAQATLLVYPHIAPIAAFGLPARHPFGDETTPRRLLEDPLRMAGVRDYVLGDDPRRIHWKASARAGGLRSKIYEPSTQFKLLLVLDITTNADIRMGTDPELQELAIAATASIADWALGERYATGLLVNTLLASMPGEVAPQDLSPEAVARMQAFSRRVRVPLGNGTDQRERILTSLARLVPYFGSPIEALLADERSTLPIGTTVVLVSAAEALRPATIDTLYRLRAHGSAVHLILTGDREAPLHEDIGGLPVTRIGGKETWDDLVKSLSDDDIGYTGARLHLD